MALRRVLPAVGGWERDAAGEGLRIDGHRLVRADGVACAMVETGSADVTALDAARRAALVGAFAQLCRTLEHPLQVVVQVRQIGAATPDHARAADADPRLAIAGARLAGATAGHHAARLRESPAYRRSVLLVPTAPTAPALDRALRGVLSTLDACELGGRTLGGDELAARVAEAWGGEPDVGAAPRRPPWSMHAGSARSGTLLVRGLALRRFPGTLVDAGWLAPLLLSACECDVALHLHPVPVAAAMTALGRRLRDLRADQLIEIDRESVGDARISAGVDSVLDLRDRLARNQARPLRMSLTATARASCPADLDHAAEALRLGFLTILTTSETLHLRHLDAAATCWPLGDDRLGITKLVDSVAASSCVPWVEAVCDDPGGAALGRALQGDGPVRVAPFDTAHHANANIAVFAASGQGKSYVLGTIVLEAAAHGVGSVIVDPEGEHRRLVRSLGGDVLELSPGCGAALNVFDAGDVADAGEERRAEVVATVVDLVNVLCGGGLDDVERAHVDAAATAAMRQAAADGRAPVLGDCVGALQAAAPRVAVVLRRFTGGPLGDLFNRPTSARLDAAVVGVSLAGLKDEFVPPATLIVASWLWSLVRRDQRRRHLVFDEVGMLCAHPPLRSLLVQLARRCRKYQASLVVATQNAGDLLATEEGTVVATNPAIVLCGGHRGAETARMQAAFSLTDDQRRLLERAGRGEFLLLAGSRRLAMRVAVSPLHHDLLTGR